MKQLRIQATLYFGQRSPTVHSQDANPQELGLAYEGRPYTAVTQDGIWQVARLLACLHLASQSNSVSGPCTPWIWTLHSFMCHDAVQHLSLGSPCHHAQIHHQPCQGPQDLCEDHRALCQAPPVARVDHLALRM